MNKAARSACIATETSLSREGAGDAVTPAFSTIDDALASGRNDRSVGFGTFSMRSRGARHSRNPRARARASPLTPRRRLPSTPPRPFTRPSTSGFGEGEYRCRTVPMRREMNGRGKSPGSADTLPITRKSNPAIRQKSAQPDPNSLRCERRGQNHVTVRMHTSQEFSLTHVRNRHQPN